MKKIIIYIIYKNTIMNIVIYDKITKEIVNKNNEPYILIDDNIKTIKEKLFGFLGIQMYMGFLKLEYIYENEYKIYNDNNENNIRELYISNIITELENEYDVGELYLKSDVEIAEIVEKLNNEYQELKSQDFVIALKTVLLKSNPDFYSSIRDDIQEFVERLSGMKEVLYKQYEPLQKMLMKYYNDKNMDNINFEHAVNWKSININILPKNNNDNTKQFIKMEQIFNIIQLSDTIPFISINTTQETPIIKIYNKIIETQSEKEIKSWILNEKKKAQLLSYKIIKGLFLKYKIPESNELMTIIIKNNGVIQCKLNTNKLKLKIDEIIKIMNKGVDNVINYLNSIPNVFLYSKRLQLTNNSQINIESFSGECILSGVKIDLNKITELLNNEIVRNNLFELKDIMATNMLSLFYKKTYDTNDRGITLNVEDNKYVQNSSIITVFSIKKEIQLTNIVKHLLLLGSTIDNKKVKDKSHIKDLRTQGVKILSTKCQKPRQPITQKENNIFNPQQNSYSLEYENNIYICPNPDYPFPGFTNENIVCCFKKDQRHRDTYIRNIKEKVEIDLQQIMVRPSNFKIKINNDLETYVIKIVNEYNDNFNEQNSIPRYYYMKIGELIAIKNEKLIAKLDNSNINWLDEVELSTLITTPPLNKCKNIPIMTSQTPCEHHKNNKVFGYTQESYPCCFKNDPEEVVKIKDITKQHILTMDKILDYQRIGVLPHGLKQLFNENKETFFRMGVVQNNSAFLNAVVLANNLNNEKSFKETISKYLLKNERDFEMLNDGDIYNKYKNVNTYINILKSNNVLYWYDFIDIIQKILHINILILNIPYQLVDTHKDVDYKSIRILCNQKVKKNDGKYLILLKRANTFEIVINNDQKITYLYEKNNKIVDILLNYYKTSCIKEDVFPEKYNFVIMSDINTVIKNLKVSPFKIIGQIKNSYNKIDYVLTSNNLLIPIKESGIIKDLNISEIVLNTIDNYIKYLPKISKLLGQKYDITGITTDNNNNITSFLSSYGQLIPVSKQHIKNIDKHYKILDIKYYQRNINESIRNQQVIFSDIMKKRKEFIYDIKRNLGNEFEKESGKVLKNNVINIIKSHNDKFEKIDKIVLIFKKILQNFKFDYILKIIANEIINDNIENLLLNNIILSDTFDPTEIIKRDSESILSNANEIQKWFVLFKTN